MLIRVVRSLAVVAILASGCGRSTPGGPASTPPSEPAQAGALAEAKLHFCTHVNQAIATRALIESGIPASRASAVLQDVSDALTQDIARLSAAGDAANSQRAKELSDALAAEATAFASASSASGTMNDAVDRVDAAFEAIPQGFCP